MKRRLLWWFTAALATALVVMRCAVFAWFTAVCTKDMVASGVGMLSLVWLPISWWFADWTVEEFDPVAAKLKELRPR